MENYPRLLFQMAAPLLPENEDKKPEHDRNCSVQNLSRSVGLLFAAKNNKHLFLPACYHLIALLFLR